MFQRLNDVGFTVATNGITYWNGEAACKTDFTVLPKTPDEVVGATTTLAADAAQLAQLLARSGYPAAWAQRHTVPLAPEAAVGSTSCTAIVASAPGRVRL